MNLSSALEPNKLLLAGKYRLIAEIGRGGMADVCLAATQAQMGGFQKLVVVKLLRQDFVQEDEDCIGMFLDEARLAARLNHPNVVQTYEVGEDAGRYYLVMEYLEGQTLERIVGHSLADRFSLMMRLQMMTRVLAGLHYAHDLVDYHGTSLNVVHRDVSPSNIFVTYDGQTKLVDFGIAKAIDSSNETRVGTFKGKTRYMAPEQIAATQIDRRTDIYAAGVVLWELIARTRMWKGVRTADVMRRVALGDLPSLRAAVPNVPEELERICRRALALLPNDRYPTAAALEGDLDAYLRAGSARVSDRDTGDVLREMFADDRARMRAAIEARLERPGSVDNSDLPSINIRIEGSQSASSFGSASERSSAVAPTSPEAGAVAQPPASEPGSVGWRRFPRPMLAVLVPALLAGIAGVAAWVGSASPKPGASAATVVPPPTESAPKNTAAQPVRGVTDTEVLCGMSAAFSGPARELGNHMKLGVETAFAAINEQGGINGRTLRLVALDDGYEGTRAGDNMKELLDNRGVFAVLGNVGTPTAQVAAPYAVQHKTIFFGAFTGAKILRQEPPDRYVFNYRASYEEETAKMVRYLVEAKKIAPSSIVVFAQHDGYGDAGFAGVAKTMRKYGRGDSDILRLNYERNTVDVDGAVRDLAKYDSSHRVAAVIMVGTYKAAARFIQRVKDKGLSPLFLNVSFVGSNSLADELKELGAGYAPGVIVTQVVPNYDSNGTGVLRYREALSHYHPDQQPDFISLEGYAVANLFAEGLRLAGRDLDTEKLVDAFESIRAYEMGLGTSINFGMSEHQGSHKVWGTVIDAAGRFQSLDMD